MCSSSRVSRRIVSTCTTPPMVVISLAGRPFDGESNDGKRVAWTAFVTEKTLLTVSKSGTLILWSIPDGKAIYIAERACQGVAALSPGRKSLVIFRDNILRFLDPATGDLIATTQPLSSSGTTGLQAAAFRRDGRELAVIANETLARVDLTNGKVVEEFASPIAAATALQYASPKFVLVDNRQVFELEKKRVVWNFLGGIHGSGGPDGLHWEVPRVIGQMGSLRALELPSSELLTSLIAEGSTKTKTLLREGTTVAIQVEGAPPRDPEGFRRQVIAGLSDQLAKLGAKAGAGGSAKLIASFQERETGMKIELVMFGGGRKDPEKRIAPERELTCRLTLNDGSGAPILLYEQKTGSRLYGMQGVPAGDNDWEGYLRNKHWLNVAKLLDAVPLPYFVGRSGNSVALLPGYLRRLPGIRCHKRDNSHRDGRIAKSLYLSFSLWEKVPRSGG